ncbi:sulfate ABC transporter substrate-binding protein [Moraxella porci DSM 25326]|uniref:Sulfate ABC transporter substrate-binding protein n=1 Tax=Moraxella porci DSM 25326 TaxID=573983 RepID=A0A1T0CX12_9GAMM|nr:sulfate ABC transporter substrate-binding protein [Moraxella porci]OOS26779.1 sulfate ABC transporter substrate-binding protein [Moraxella porci DSM 25326]
MTTFKTTKLLAVTLGASLALTACSKSEQKTETTEPAKPETTTAAGGIELLNVSYDVSRDFYKDYNEIFKKHYLAQHPGAKIEIKQSHGGSSKQALSVKNGLQADVATMNQGSDIELLADAKLVDANWRQEFPNNAIPFTSTIVFLVREGNPKGVKDWNDLTTQGTEIVIANPKTTGNGRYAFLGAYGYGLHTFNKDEAKTKDFAKQLLSNVKVFENGGRAATTTFAQRGIGDVLITFENEANVIKGKFGNVEIVYPSYTVNAENPVAVVKSVTDSKGTTDAAKEYLNYLYSDEAQELATNFYLRPSNADILAKHQDKFPAMTTFFPNEVFGDWASIMSTYFSEGGIYDQLAVEAQNK